MEVDSLDKDGVLVGVGVGGGVIVLVVLPKFVKLSDLELDFRGLSVMVDESDADLEKDWVDDVVTEIDADDVTEMVADRSFEPVLLNDVVNDLDNDSDASVLLENDGVTSSLSDGDDVALCV